MFTVEKENENGIIYWQCENRDDCRARVHTRNGQIVKWAHAIHNHPSVPGKAETEEILAAMKVRATTTAEDINTIIQVLGTGIRRAWTRYYPL